MSQEASTLRPVLGPVPKTWLFGLAIACIVVLLAEFSYEKHPHPHVHYEAWFGFFGIAAIVFTAAIALVSTLLRGILRRDRGYYDG